MYLEYALRAVLSLFIDVVNRFFLNWIVVLFADTNGNLPKYLKWFQTFDATLDQGMIERRNEIAAGLGEVWNDFNPDPQTKWDVYFNRALWLFRNSSYGFDYYLLGLRWIKEDWKVVTYSDEPDRTLFIAKSSNGGFNFYYAGPKGMYKFGWKAWNLYNASTKEFDGVWGDGTKIPVVFSANPFKKK